MYFLYLQLGLASLVAITVLILLMPLQVLALLTLPKSAKGFFHETLSSHVQHGTMLL